jgi:hypothetical protein
MTLKVILAIPVSKKSILSGKINFIDFCIGAYYCIIVYLKETAFDLLTKGCCIYIKPNPIRILQVH